jgi:hypothetical protein
MRSESSHEGGASMYIGVGTVLGVILIVLLIMLLT